MEPAPEFKSAEVVLDEAKADPQPLFYRDFHEAFAYLMANPGYKDSMGYEAKEIFEADGVTRVYTEMWTGKKWSELQVRNRAMPETLWSTAI